MKNRIILKYLFSFIFFILFLSLILLLVLKGTIFNKSYLLSTLENNNYYEKINNEIQEEMEDIITSTGLDKEVLKDIYTKEEVKNDINLYINNYYDGKTISFNKENISNNLKKNIDEYLKNNNIDVVNNNDIDDFVIDVVNIYKDEVSLYKIIDSFANSFSKINNLLNYGIIILLIVNIIVLLINIKIRNSYLMSSFIACGLILLFLRLVIYEKIDVVNILIISKDFSLIIKSVISYIGLLFLIIGISVILLGFVLGIVVIKCQKKKIKNINN